MGAWAKQNRHVCSPGNVEGMRAVIDDRDRLLDLAADVLNQATAEIEKRDRQLDAMALEVERLRAENARLKPRGPITVTIRDADALAEALSNDVGTIIAYTPPENEQLDHARSLIARFLVLMPERHGECGKACAWCEAVEFNAEAR